MAGLQRPAHSEVEAEAVEQLVYYKLDGSAVRMLPTASGCRTRLDIHLTFSILWRAAQRD
jgi:hypothetical protein